VKLLQAALTKNPENADAWFWLAKCYFHDFVDSQHAKQALEKALEIEPNRADCLNLMASVLMDLKIAPEKCLRLVERAIELAPDWISLHKNRAMILLQMKHYDEAEAEVQRTFSLISPSPEPKDSVEEYYEEAVTGRRRPNIHKELDDLLQRIREAKSSQSILRKLFR
jgi:Tfp pilus assembly protein PilF